MAHVGAMCTCYVVDHCCLHFYFVARQAPWHMLVQCVRVMLLITAVYLFILWPDKHHGTCWCNVYVLCCWSLLSSFLFCGQTSTMAHVGAMCTCYVVDHCCLAFYCVARQAPWHMLVQCVRVMLLITAVYLYILWPDKHHGTCWCNVYVLCCWSLLFTFLFCGQTSTMAHVGAMCTCYVVDHCCLAFYFVARQAPWHMLVQCVHVMLLITAVYLFIVWPDKHHGTCWCNVYVLCCWSLLFTFLFCGQTSTMAHVGAMCTCYVVDHCCLAFYFVARQAPWHMLVQCVRVMLLITAV